MIGGFVDFFTVLEIVFSGYTYNWEHVPPGSVPSIVPILQIKASFPNLVML